MAKYIENFKSKLDWSNVLQRTAAVPLDRTELFESLADATLYAQGGADARNLSGTSYIGQIVVVHENDDVKAYIIENKIATSFDAEGKETDKSTRTLKELAGAKAAAGDVESALQQLNDHITAYNTKVTKLEDADKAIMGELGEDEERAYASLIELERALKQEVTDRGTADSGLQKALDGEIARAKAAEEGLQDAIDDLADSVTTTVNGVIGTLTGTGLQDKEVEGDGLNNTVAEQLTQAHTDIVAEAVRADAVEKALAGRLDVIEGEAEGSIKKAVADEAARINEVVGDLTKTGLEGTTIEAQLTDAKAEIDALDSAVEKELGTFSVAADENGEGAVVASGLRKEIEDRDAAVLTEAKKHATDSIAAVVAEAPEAFDTLKEIAEWIANADDQVSKDAEKLVVTVDRLDGAETVQGSVKQQIKDVVDAQALVDKGLDGRLDALEAKFADGGDQAQKDAAQDKAIEDLGALVGTLPADAKEDNLVDHFTGAIAEVESALDDYIGEVAGTVTGLNQAITDAQDAAKRQVEAEAKTREDADTALDGKITTLRSDMVAVFTALELTGEEAQDQIKIQLVLEGREDGEGMHGVKTPLGEVTLDVMKDDEVKDMLRELGVLEEEVEGE